MTKVSNSLLLFIGLHRRAGFSIEQIQMVLKKINYWLIPITSAEKRAIEKLGMHGMKIGFIKRII